MPDGPLVLWTIYDHPRDHPDAFVARRWDVLPSGLEPGELVAGDTLEEVRAAIPPGLFRVERAPEDDPAIVETWI